MSQNGCVPIEPDTKDWTWVLERPCPDCGFDSATVAVADIGATIRADAEAWRTVLARPVAELRTRPREDTWSPVEYACHVRDVHRVFAERLRLMLDHDDPEFASWDQDQAAVVGEYAAAAPADVLPALVAAADEVAELYDGVPGDAWERTGRRGNGSAFTIASLGRYHLHDLAHHLVDVGHDPDRA